MTPASTEAAAAYTITEPVRVNTTPPGPKIKLPADLPIPIQRPLIAPAASDIITPLASELILVIG